MYAAQYIPKNAVVSCFDLTGTGEHGVGVGKKEYLTEELGKGTVDLMKRIKKIVDPHNIMNPGKVSLRSVITSLDLRPHQLYPD
jgi:hypothetical protein